MVHVDDTIILLIIYEQSGVQSYCRIFFGYRILKKMRFLKKKYKLDIIQSWMHQAEMNQSDEQSLSLVRVLQLYI